MINKIELCKCGCGKEVKSGNMYIHGHNRAGLPSNTINGRWSTHYDQCVECGTKESKHVGRGLCRACHKRFMYKQKKQKIGKWSRKYIKCVQCGTNKTPHRAKGLCQHCYANNINKKKGKRIRVFGQWSWYYDKCTQCGTTKISHQKDGLCTYCCEQNKRNLDKCIPCPVCGVMVEKLNQHLTMRSKKCKKHYDYQHTLFKQYFESDLGLGDIAKEIDGERHAVTRQFNRFFGKEETRIRNENVRRCSISEKAVINHNSNNRRGTIVEYSSPNQGIIKLRSKLEAIYADILDKKGINWYYEYKSFPYIDKNGKRRTYTPDFFLPAQNKFIEIKGFRQPNDDYKVEYLQNIGVNIEMILQKDVKEALCTEDGKLY